MRVSASSSCPRGSGAPAHVNLRGSMPPRDENERSIRAKVHDQRDDPWESVVEACTFPADGLAHSGNAQPRSQSGSWYDQLVIGRFGLL